MTLDPGVVEALNAFGITGAGLMVPHPAYRPTGFVPPAASDDEFTVRAYVLLAGRPLPPGNILVIPMPPGNILVIPNLHVCYECRWCTFFTTGRMIYEVARPDGAEGPWYEVLPTCADCLPMWLRQRGLVDAEARMVRCLDDYLADWRAGGKGLSPRANRHETMTTIIKKGPEMLAAKRESVMRARLAVYAALRSRHAESLAELLRERPFTPAHELDGLLASIESVLGE